VLQSAILDLHVWPLGQVKLVTSLFFDIGVYLVVLGLVLDILRSLGAGVDRQAAVPVGEPAEEPAWETAEELR
jgi:multicomponent Na+:H+ antiporter subunit A